MGIYSNLGNLDVLPTTVNEGKQKTFPSNRRSAWCRSCNRISSDCHWELSMVPILALRMSPSLLIFKPRREIFGNLEKKKKPKKITKYYSVMTIFFKKMAIKT